MGRYLRTFRLRYLPPSLRFFPIDALPFDEIGEREIGAVLRRYARERSQDKFGIYMDSADGGRVAMLSDPPRAWDRRDA